MAEVDAVVIGAGAVGLACALSLARRGNEVFLLEREAGFGSGTSSRNSGVIHAGLYYPAGSLKARLCVEGRERLYTFCTERGVEHRRIGKLIFAADEAELAGFEPILAQAQAAGVDDLRPISAAEARSLEPELRCVAALHSPSTGIVDAHGFMAAMLGEISDRGGQLVCRTEVQRLIRSGAEWQITLAGSTGPDITTRLLVNAAGLGAQRLAGATEGLDPAHVPELVLARGNYFSYSGRVPFTHLIYPLPVPGGLGTHLTLDLGGRARFGPDVEWIDAIDYSVDVGRVVTFAEAARQIWAGIDPSLLTPDFAGIRPKLSRAGGDFMISGPADHGLSGLVNLFGIESPGLTASLAIGEEVALALDDQG